MLQSAQKVLVLKSNVETLADKMKIQLSLDRHPGIAQWSVDLDDCDHVLRIVTEQLNISDIETVISEHGYTCSELD